MGVFGFIQGKVEERILDEIFKEMVMSYGIVGNYKTFDCHLVSGRKHKSIGMLIERDVAAYFHFCDAVGYSGLQAKGTKLEWFESSWLTSNVKQSSGHLYEFILALKRSLL